MGPTSGFRRRPTGNTIYDCSVRRRSHSDSLWAVAWNPLLDRKCFISCPFSAPKALEIVKMAQKSRFRARRAPFSDFQAVFSGNFHVWRCRADIFFYFSLCSRCRRYFAVIFKYFPDVERQRSGDAPLVARTQQRLVLLSFS